MLARGADVNAVYHELDVPRKGMPWDKPVLPPLRFSYGRAVQLAMELGRDEAVGLLIRSGANVRLKPPVWDGAMGHECPLLPRDVNLRVTVGLERAYNKIMG